MPPVFAQNNGLDEELAKYASDYAKLLAKGNNCKMSHTFKGHDPAKDMQAGENLSACDPKKVLSKDKQRQGGISRQRLGRRRLRYGVEKT